MRQSTDARRGCFRLRGAGGRAEVCEAELVDDEVRAAVSLMLSCTGKKPSVESCATRGLNPPDSLAMLKEGAAFDRPALRPEGRVCGQCLGKSVFVCSAADLHGASHGPARLSPWRPMSLVQ